jgi:hypothetical protein
MLTHSHSATSLYNLGQFKPISDQVTSIVYVLPASNLRTGTVWPRVLMLFFAIFTFWLQKYLDFVLFSRAILPAILFRSYLSTWKLILFCMVSSQILHIYYFIKYLYSKTIIVLCNILNSQNIAGNIFVNEQCHRKLMFSGDIELNRGPVFLY